MGRIGDILSVTKSKIRDAAVTLIKSNIGGGENSSDPLFSASGDDSPPLIKDDILLVEQASKGTYGAAGSLDHDNQQKAEPGEKRIYARDPEGLEVCEIHLKADSSIKASNSFGFIELLADGKVSINGVIFDTAQNITNITEATMDEAIINGVTESTHIHNQPNDSDGDVEEPTDGPEDPAP